MRNLTTPARQGSGRTTPNTAPGQTGHFQPKELGDSGCWKGAATTHPQAGHETLSGEVLTLHLEERSILISAGERNLNRQAFLNFSSLLPLAYALLFCHVSL